MNTIRMTRRLATMTASEISTTTNTRARELSAGRASSDAEQAALEEAGLVQRMLAGDENAFTLLYRRSHGAVYRFALQMTGRVASAEDVTQEVFLVLMKRGKRFDPGRGTLSAFLYGIARNVLLKKLEKEPEMSRQVPDDAVEQRDELGVDPLTDFERRETIERVRLAVLTLPLVYREAVVLCDLEDASYEEAAAILECPVGTVRSRLSRARVLLASKLEARLDGKRNARPDAKRDAKQHAAVKKQEPGSRP